MSNLFNMIIGIANESPVVEERVPVALCHSYRGMFDYSIGYYKVGEVKVGEMVDVNQDGCISVCYIPPQSRV